VQKGRFLMWRVPAKSVSILILLTILLAVPLVLSAAERTPATASPQSDPRVRFDTDQEAGFVRVIIDNREVARIDSAGLHVRNDIEYGGTITDTGIQYFDERAGGRRAPQ
jgi:hypothetical protein